MKSAAILWKGTEYPTRFSWGKMVKGENIMPDHTPISKFIKTLRTRKTDITRSLDELFDLANRDDLKNDPNIDTLKNTPYVLDVLPQWARDALQRPPRPGDCDAELGLRGRRRDVSARTDRTPMCTGPYHRPLDECEWKRGGAVSPNLSLRASAAQT